MKTQFLSTMFGAALAIGAVATFAQPQSASAMTLPITSTDSATQSFDTSLPVIKVKRKHRRAHRRAHRRHARRHIYRRHRHGPRYRHWRRGHHFYNGFWYAVPFWLGTTYYDAPYYAPPRRYSRHVRWCLNRYRSYRIKTDTFRGFDGYDHRCRSPYRR